MKSQEFKLNNGEVLEIRLGKESDAAQLTTLVENILVSSPFVVTTPAEFAQRKESSKERIRKLNQHPSEIIIVASIHQRLVGNLDFICGKRQRLAHTGEIGMGLHENYRGLGIGQRLLKVFLDWANKTLISKKLN